MEEDDFGVKTYSPVEIAQKHSVPLADILKELLMGLEVETEHTHDEALTYQISLDHLLEIPDYYTRLAIMEKEAEV